MTAAVSCARLGLRDALLRKQQEGQEHGAADARDAGEGRERRRELLERAAGDQPRVGPLPRLPQADRHVARAGDPLGQEAGGVEVATGARDEQRVGRIDREVEAHGVGEPGEQRVVEEAEPPPRGRGRGQVVVEDPARRLERRSRVVERVLLRADRDRGPQEEGHGEQRDHDREHEERDEPATERAGARRPEVGEAPPGRQRRGSGRSDRRAGRAPPAAGSSSAAVRSRCRNSGPGIATSWKPSGLGRSSP